ncbi:response regulator, partial [Alkalihalophilus lindianensis]
LGLHLDFMDLVNLKKIHRRKGASTMYTLMLIEDDTQLSELIQDYMERYGYTVHQPENFTNIIEEFTRIQPDLVLLDLNLPYYDGYF